MALVKELFKPGNLVTAPGIFDGISARMADPFEFDLLYMTGYGTVASYLGVPDAGIASYADMVGRVQMIANVIKTPFIADGDTGYGNAMNVRRTLKECAKAGCAGILIEDQMAPKRCGHTPGKDVVGREEAFDRIRAANDMRNEGYDILIMARTDANHTHGLNEAIFRAQKFYELGADILFVEAPKDKDEMKTICKEVPGFKIANIVEGGITPNLPMNQLRDNWLNLISNVEGRTTVPNKEDILKELGLEIMAKRPNHIKEGDELIPWHINISKGVPVTAIIATLTPVSYTHLTLPTKRIV